MNSTASWISPVVGLFVGIVETPFTALDRFAQAVSAFRVRDSLPFMDFHTNFAMIVLYLSVVFALKTIMVAYNFRPVMARSFSVIHNTFLVCLSVFIFLCAAASLSSRIRQGGLYAVMCDGTDGLDGAAGLACYLYYLSKFVEFLDTVILVLRGKALSVLHVYHHTAICLVSWLFLKHRSYGNTWLAGINSGIHIIMYYYYLQCDLGRRPPWKKLLTTAQIVQLNIGFVIAFFFLLYRSRGHACNVFEMQDFLFALFGDIILIMLFLNFYAKSYGQPAPAKQD